MSDEATICSLSGGIEKSLSLSEAREGREEVVGKAPGQGLSNGFKDHADKGKT